MTDRPRNAATRTVVVGYDGSPASRAAVQYAAARVGDGRLVVVHTYATPIDAVGQPYLDEALAAAVSDAQDLMDRLSEDFPELAGVDVEPDVLNGHAATALCRVAETRDADEIVVGTRGTGRVRSLLGSVAHDVLHRATCPVVVIPARAVDRTPVTGTAA